METRAQGWRRPLVLCASLLATLLAPACEPWRADDTVHYARPAPWEHPLTPRDSARSQDTDSQAVAVHADASFDPAEVDLSGTWAQLQVTAAVSEAPFVGELHSQTRAVLRVEQIQQGPQLSMHVVVCDLDVETEGPIATLIPDAFVAALPATDRHGTARLQGNELHFQQERIYQVIGAQLTEPDTEVLPEDDDDPRAIDLDGDGHPGMTIELSGLMDGQLYVVQRMWNELTGLVWDADHIDGLITWNLEQVTLGASLMFLDIDARPHPNPAPERSYFRTTRVASGATCADILAQQQALFARGTP